MKTKQTHQELTSLEKSLIFLGIGFYFLVVADIISDGLIYLTNY
jgi:hypothetical protein